MLTASFIDYAIPRADGVEMTQFTTDATMNFINRMGIEGCCAVGRSGVLTAMTNAVKNAVWAVMYAMFRCLSPHGVCGKC